MLQIFQLMTEICGSINFRIEVDQWAKVDVVDRICIAVIDLIETEHASIYNKTNIINELIFKYADNENFSLKIQNNEVFSLAHKYLAELGLNSIDLKDKQKYLFDLKWSDESKLYLLFNIIESYCSYRELQKENNINLFSVIYSELILKATEICNISDKSSDEIGLLEEYEILDSNKHQDILPGNTKEYEIVESNDEYLILDKLKEQSLKLQIVEKDFNIEFFIKQLKKNIDDIENFTSSSINYVDSEMSELIDILRRYLDILDILSNKVANRYYEFKNFDFDSKHLDDQVLYLITSLLKYIMGNNREDKEMAVIRCVNTENLRFYHEIITKLTGFSYSQFFDFNINTFQYYFLISMILSSKNLKYISYIERVFNISNIKIHDKDINFFESNLNSILLWEIPEAVFKDKQIFDFCIEFLKCHKDPNFYLPFNILITSEEIKEILSFEMIKYYKKKGIDGDLEKSNQGDDNENEEVVLRYDEYIQGSNQIKEEDQIVFDENYLQVFSD